MTEEEWLVSTDPTSMLSFVEDRLNERQKRLFAAACCRRLWHLLPDERSRSAVEVIEAYADGETSAEDLWNVCEDANVADDECDPRFGDAPSAVTDAAADFLRLADVAWTCAAAAGHDALRHAFDQSAYQEAQGADDDHPYNAALAQPVQAEEAVQAALLRDVAGDPFRPVVFAPSWRNESVRALARTIYQERAFDRLPQLADELEQAGCGEPSILSHLRGGGPHVRGCWVLDALLEPTQEEWEAIDSVRRQVERLWLWGKTSPRKLMLFGVACVTRSGIDLPESCREGVALAERFADGQATREELKAAEGTIDRLLATIEPGSLDWYAGSAVATLLGGAPVFTATMPFHLLGPDEVGEDWPVISEEDKRALLAEVVGEPFRPVRVSAAWMTPQVLRLAEAAYEQQAFEIMPVLADALEEAGCTEGRILEHCRAENEHVRGCWVLDLMLRR